MKKLLSITAAVLSAFTVSAQCPQISCPSNITVNNAPGTCGAVVNYTTPVGTNPCGAGTQTFSYTGSIVSWTVPNGVTQVTIDAKGAQGGSVNITCSASGGKGARMVGDFTVSPGDNLQILVGQMGLTNGEDAGGGGGTFVVGAGNTPLIIAGGGGGATNNIKNCGVNLNGIDASITTSATA